MTTTAAPAPRTAPALFQWAVFPVVMTGAVAWTMQLMRGGTPAATALLLPQLTAFAVVAVLEHVYPYHRSWNRPRRDVRVDATHSLTIGGLVALLTPFVLAGGVAISGCPIEALALFTLVTAVHGIFQHANLQLRLGPLNHFFSMAELHRWHHSKTIDEANHNYGQTVILWDTLFGTRFLPRHRTPPEAIGIPDLAAFPMTWWAQITSPLRWARIREESRALSAGRPT